MAIIIPQLPIKIEKPAEILSEHDKFKNNGQWFLEYARWITLNYYNTYSIPNSYTQPSGGGGLVTSSGTPVSSTGTTSIVDEMLDNYSYYYGNQNNRIFNHLTRGVNNTMLPNIWIKGQEVRSLVDHIRGKCLQMIQPIEKNISADTISENALLKKQEVFDKIDLAASIGDALEELGGGIKYNPAGEIDYSDPSAVKEAKQKVKSEYENTATIISRNAYYVNHLSDMFLHNATDTAISNLTGIEFKERDGRMEANYIPGYQSIYDFSTWGEYGEGQTKAGYIVPVTLEEILHEYPDMNPAWRMEIEEVLYKGVDTASQFMEYYNQPFTNVKWWYNDQKWMSKAVVYWLSECDTRYVEKKYSNGLKKVFKIDDYKNYHDPNVDSSNLPAGTPMKKGYELQGDSKVWKIHKAVVLGNKYLVEYGYDTYQVRPYGDKSRPIIPILFLCQGKMAGYVKSIVSRIKPKQDELDAVRYRIREYAANDLGTNIFVNGAKLTENLSALNLVNDMRSLHVSVIPATGDAELDARGMDDIIKVVATGAAAAIKDYLILKADIENEMKAILNIPDAALGQQDNVIGKGVQQATVARSELSGLPFFSSLQEYWRRVLQYASNKNKMILLDNVDKNTVIPISAREAKILKLTKQFSYEYLNVYISPNDLIQEGDIALVRQMLQGYSQNPTVEHLEGILCALKLLPSKSFNEGIVMIEEYVERKKTEQERLMLRQATTEQQTMAFQQQSAQIAQMQAEMAKLMTELAKIQAKSAWEIKKEEVKAGIDRQFQYDDAIIAQVTDLVSKQLFATGQQQGQPAAQQAA